MSYFLGIDTGGTYTDAVLVDETHQVVAAAKSLTTRHDLTVGIGAALGQLPAERLRAVRLVSLSTTLTTNAVVEGKGAAVCVLLAGYNEQQVSASGLRELLGPDSVVLLAGGHDAGGLEREPLDEAAARQAILANRDKVSAFAVSALFGVRNPTHELKLRDMVRAVTGKPVTCGHELASSLGAPRRAMTVALNARMIPHVEHLIDSVRHILAERGIAAPLMIVKGDGSLINAESALQRPVGTVLSGPAASVMGACALSGLSDAIVADMGGTTTDIAVVRNGQPDLSFDGALIGDWQPMVEAVRVYSIGLGGDSEVRFNGGAGMVIGPRRVVPMSLLADQHPQVLPRLEWQLRESPNPRHNKFVLRLQPDAPLLSQLPADERRAWDALAAGPIELDRATQEDRPLARALARLERKGLAIYSGFTPSDAAHVLGLTGHWNSAAATLAARIWARQMRWVYGHGGWADGDAITPSREVVQHVTESIGQRLIEAGLHDAGRLDEDRSRKLARLLAEMILGAGDTETPNSLFALRFAPELPVVAVGAPAASYYPEVARRLGIGLHLPKHAEVANAVGAVMGKVTQRVHLSITQPARGTFRVYAKDGPQDFPELGAAIAQAERLAVAEAEALALEAGAAVVETTVKRRDNNVNLDVDSDLFFETRITATATGRPRLGAIGETLLQEATSAMA
ncbi:hydantoinase/oxoprolinase N-terminal domain-containing protein [Azoarcus sp. KH32C]|uniref:hydantoinase/oxoprolinase N-terminal domain-containing protein n=1 Tax=Azoarcus sp. KH32C TaxID=748247 RepID=UPI0002385D6B|nr:hydantoinase/oxoprolinase family protein [Azoarcus sp. KH32C]BAL27035.1 hypothetical protein AZKH_p0152 [Azoarcus sp. KH32C]